MRHRRVGQVLGALLSITLHLLLVTPTLVGAMKSNDRHSPDSLGNNGDENSTAAGVLSVSFIDTPESSARAEITAERLPSLLLDPKRLAAQAKVALKAVIAPALKRCVST